MSSARKGATSAFPSYDDLSEDDKKSKGINQLITKYFAPTGILALLILKSIVSTTTDSDAEDTPLRSATDTPATPGTAHTSETTDISTDVMITDLCLRQVRLIMRSSFIPCMNDLGINIEHVNTVYGKGMSPSDILSIEALS